MTQHLVVIAGNKAYRYDGPKRIEEADLCMEDQTIEEAKAAIEDFRKNGLPPPIIQPADIAFERVARELTTKHPLEGMTNEELKALWDLEEDSASMLGTHYRIEDVHAELNRRGLGSYCAV